MPETKSDEGKWLKGVVMRFYGKALMPENPNLCVVEIRDMVYPYAKDRQCGFNRHSDSDLCGLHRFRSSKYGRESLNIPPDFNEDDLREIQEAMGRGEYETAEQFFAGLRKKITKDQR